MKLQNQVSSLEPSQKLKELGVRVNSYFYWCEWKSDSGKVVDMIFPPHLSESKKKKDRVSAFTVAELGNILAPILTNEIDIPDDLTSDTKGDFAELYDPDYLARLLIYLIEQGLVDVKTLSV